MDAAAGGVGRLVPLRRRHRGRARRPRRRARAAPGSATRAARWPPRAAPAASSSACRRRPRRQSPCDWHRERCPSSGCPRASRPPSARRPRVRGRSTLGFMRGIVGGLLVVAALAVAAAPPAQGAESGVNIALHQNVDGPSNAQRLRVGWVRIFVGWSLGEPARGDYDRDYLIRSARGRALPRARRQDAARRPGHARLGGRPARRGPGAAGGPGRLRALRRRAGARRRPGRDRDLERGRLGDLLARRAGPGRLRGAAARLLRPHQGGGAERDRGDQRHGRQPLRVPAQTLRQRRRRLLRRGRRAHRHRLPADLARRVLPRAQRPRRALLVHGLPRGPRRDDRQRRRRQGRVDDRDRLEHGLAQAALVPGRRGRGHPRRGREREDPGPLPQARLPLPRRRPGRARGAVVLAAGRRRRRRLRRPPRADAHQRHAQARLPGDAQGPQRQGPGRPLRRALRSRGARAWPSRARPRARCSPTGRTCRCA